MAKNRKTTFRILSLLKDSIKNKEEILSELGISESNFSSCLHKIRKSGLDVLLNNKSYRVSQIQHSIDFTEEEKSLMAYLLYICNTKLPICNTRIYAGFLKKVLFFGHSQDYDDVMQLFHLYRKIFHDNLNFERLQKVREIVQSKEKIRITLLTGKIIYIKPIDFNWDKNSDKIYLNYTTDSTTKNYGRILLEEIIKIEPEEKLEIKDLQEDEIIFELYGNLAESYLLKMDERIIRGSKTKLVIASSTKDRDSLYKRLLRYDTLCRVLKPKKAVDEFVDIINTSLLNIGCSIEKEQEYIYSEGLFEE